jgi:hypothetical protein
MRVEPLDGPYYTLERAHRQCTVCNYLLPPNIERVPSITLAVVGDTFSGKSHYIAAFIRQLETEWLNNATNFTRFICLTPDVQKTYTTNYFEPLFVDRQTLAQTQPATSPYAQPLIYKLVVSPSPRHPTTATNLMIYDTAGEDFESEERLASFARFVHNSSAFVFVADPFTMSSIFSSLPPALQTNLQQAFTLAQGRRAAVRLNAIISVYESFRREVEGASLPNTPIAVMVSKSDLFRTFLPPNKYNFLTNPFYGNGLNLQDIERVNLEVRDLLTMLQQHDLLGTTSRFKRVKFFATSSTGEPPDEHGRFARVTPNRCLDPVLWILHELGIVTGKE